MGAKESTEETPNITPTDNARCTCPWPHRSNDVQEAQKSLNTEPVFDPRQVRSDLIELARFFKAPTGTYSNEAGGIERQIFNKNATEILKQVEKWSEAVLQLPLDFRPFDQEEMRRLEWTQGVRDAGVAKVRGLMRHGDGWALLS